MYPYFDASINTDFFILPILKTYKTRIDGKWAFYMGFRGSKSLDATKC
jgi:hypothetical protein